MLSRRSARIKVMQMLYASNRDQDITLKEAQSRYWIKIDQSKELLLFTLYVITNITKTSIDDGVNRKKKYLPSEEDKAFTPILHQNDYVQKIFNNKSLKALFKKHNFSELIDSDLASKIYYNFTKEQAFKDYLLGDHSDQATESILLELFKFCRASENFVELLEDQYVNWDDDKSIVIGSIKKIIKSLKSDKELNLKPYDPDDETVKDFGETLLKRTFTDDESLLEKIEPVLKNWDSDRVAIIDLIFLKMALCELIMFETIPSKVTLNEYVELAKLYSTPKSKEFINGVLDTLVADLTASKEIVKKGRGLVD